MMSALHTCFRLALPMLLIFNQQVGAQVLPEDRFESLYHSYDGDEVKITGPSILLRKAVTADISLYANYYVDDITSASIDVRSSASPDGYDEERTEWTFGGDMLVGDTVLSAGWTNSDENDFEADTAYFGISQEVFGGLTTVRLAYSRGWDTVQDVTTPTFSEDVDRRAYRVGISQVMTKNLIMTLDYEGRSDEGYLNNPYRSVRYSIPSGGVGWEPERYPETRDSWALSLGGRYFLEPVKRSAIYANARYYDDNWEIDAFNITTGYTLAIWNDWIMDISYRYYTQNEAEFYSDLYPFQDSQNFLGRDKEISKFENQTIRLGLTYDFPVNRFELIQRGTLNLDVSEIWFEYDNFRDATSSEPADQQPLFDFDATVVQFYVSIWF